MIQLNKQEYEYIVANQILVGKLNIWNHLELVLVDVSHEAKIGAFLNILRGMAAFYVGCMCTVVPKFPEQWGFNKKGLSGGV